MIDPFEVVGERVRYWSEINNPNAGKGTYVPSKSKMRIEAQELVFGEVLPGEITPEGVYQASWENNTSAENTQTFSVNETTSDTYSWSLSAGLSVSTTFEAKVPFVGGVENSIEMSVNTESTETTSTEKAWTYTGGVLVPARSKVVSSFIVNKANYSVPFTAKVRVRGSVYIKFANKSVFHRDIDDLIEKVNWSPSTFNVHTDGKLAGVIGQSFTVRTDEYSLDGARSVRSRVIDQGHWIDGKTISVPQARMFAAELEPQ